MTKVLDIVNKIKKKKLEERGCAFIFTWNEENEEPTIVCLSETD
jgi:hypothetical protein